MNLIDTHTHLYLEQFDNDLDLVIQNAISDGVTKFLLPNISSSTTKSLMNICKQYHKNCFPMIGLHPCDVKAKSMVSELAHVEDMLNKETFIGIGEIGIDLYWDKSTLNIQKEALTHQINLAKKYKLPIAIHVRDSFSETIEIIENLNDENLRGVFHCFTGNIEQANRVISLDGFYLGIGGVLTFKNSGLDKTIENINIKNIVLETDSPFLAPHPFRGKRNESKYLINIAKKLAEIQNIDLQTAAQITSENAIKLFNLS